MTDVWTTQRVLDLAPDAASAKAGQGLAKANKWPTLGRDEAVVWGEAQGSGKNPYQVRVDLREPAFKCSCPSRKFPCKHALGLLLLLAGEPGALKAGPPPEWVTEWLESREARAEKQKAKAEAKAAAPVDEEAQAKRVAKREANVGEGIEELRLFLADVARQGLATAQTRPASYWAQAAARMVDAQAPGLARLVRQLGAAVGAGKGWQSRFVRQAGRLHLALEGYGRLDRLPEATQADLRATIGWTQSRDELLLQAAEAGPWCVVGRQLDESDRIVAQSTWLLRRSDGRPALLLDFAAGNQPLDTGWLLGTMIEADLVFYPGAAPLRAMAKERRGDARPLDALPGARSAAAALEAYATALAGNPWLERWPMALDDVMLVARREGEATPLRWSVADGEETELPLTTNFGDEWSLLSLSGGRPFSLFGVWDGEALAPLGAWVDGAYYSWPRGAVLARMT